MERLDYRDSRGVGAAHTFGLLAGAVLTGVAAERLVRRSAVAQVLATAAATFVVLGGRSLRREASTIAGQLSTEDLAAAREQVTHLVGRDTSELDTAQITRATVESLAENTADAVVSPLLWGAVAGIPGLLGYRSANTLDAMIGHRSVRYEQFGWAAARLDDVLNFLPARVCVGLIALSSPVVGGRPGASIATARRDGPGHPSPNAGPVEAAFAGALGCTLGGVNAYHGRTEDRGTLGEGPSPRLPDIARATRLSALVSGLQRLALTVAAVSAALRFGRR